MENIVSWYECVLGQYISREVSIFIMSMLPFIELKGGLAVDSLLKVPLKEANVIYFLGNLLPILVIMSFI